jgi:hypothetical protein
MKRTLDEMWTPQVSATSSSSLPSPSPSATFAEHALVARDLMEEVSVQFIEGGVVQAQLEGQSVDLESSSDDEETVPSPRRFDSNVEYLGFPAVSD